MKAARKRPSKLQDNLVYGLVWLACFAPLVWLAWRGVMGELGANPIEKLIRELGVWGLRLLLVGLAWLGRGRHRGGWKGAPGGLLGRGHA